jgi:hypothetical protein
MRRLFTILLLLSLTGCSVSKDRAQAQLRSCYNDCRNVSTALEMYATDNEGHYPQALSMLTPNYLRELPTCPAAGRDSYSPSYRATSSALTDQSGLAPYDQYSFFCKGNNHKSAGMDPNVPGMDSWEGFFESGLPKVFAPGEAPDHLQEAYEAKQKRFRK